jgi:endonuclease V
MDVTAIQIQWEEEQNKLSEKVLQLDFINFNDVVRVGGVDISFKKDSETEACVGLVVLELPTFQILYQNFEQVQLDLPYIPGYLAFREAPHILKLIEKLRQTQPDLLPQVIFVDGNGVLHPRGCGLASHLGLVIGPFSSLFFLLFLSFI